MTNATTLEMIRRQAEGAMDGPAPARPAAPPDASAVCPYCGHREHANAEECSECRGLFEPLSRIATQNAMGPWQLRDEANPFRPGCSIETLRALIGRGKITRETVLRGPTTRQFWMRAAEIRGVAHLLGSCHACKGAATAKDHFCRSCGASFVAENDRNWLGLDAVRPLTATAIGSQGETEPKATPAPGPHEHPATPGPEMAGSGFVDLFAGPIGSPHSPAPYSIRSGGRERRQRARSVRHAITAATVALCAAALSVAVWAASAAQAVSGSPEPKAPASEAEITGETGSPSGHSTSASPVPAQAQPDATLPVPESWHVRLTAALALGEADDIKSLEQAVSILRQLEQEAPQAAADEGLSERIEALERRVDDLTIRKFLRKDP
jgi:hypothetical protein